MGKSSDPNCIIVTLLQVGTYLGSADMFNGGHAMEMYIVLSE